MEICSFGFRQAGTGTPPPEVQDWADVLALDNESGANDAIWSKTGTAVSTATQVGSQIASFQTSLDCTASTSHRKNGH